MNTLLPTVHSEGQSERDRDRFGMERERARERVKEDGAIIYEKEGVIIFFVVVLKYWKTAAVSKKCT